MIIIMMLIVALVGAGLLALFSTSSYNQLEAQKAAKAYYLSESGVRIAVGEFHAAAASTANQNATLVSLQGKTFNLPNNGGSVTLQIYPYWFYVNSAFNANSTSITLYFPGMEPLINNNGSSYTLTTLPAPGILKLRGYTKVGVFTSATVGSLGANGTPVAFTVSSYYPCTTTCTGFPYALSAGGELYLGYVYNSPQAVQMGGNLVFNDPNGTAAMYPPINGSIVVVQQPGRFDEYTYSSRIPQSINPSSPPSSFTLQNIQQATSTSLNVIDIKYNSASPYDPNYTTQIYLGKTLGINSKSEYVN